MKTAQRDQNAVRHIEITEPKVARKYEKTNQTVNVLLFVIYAAYQKSQFGWFFDAVWFLPVFALFSW